MEILATSSLEAICQVLGMRDLLINPHASAARRHRHRERGTQRQADTVAGFVRDNP